MVYWAPAVLIGISVFVAWAEDTNPSDTRIGSIAVWIGVALFVGCGVGLLWPLLGAAYIRTRSDLQKLQAKRDGVLKGE